MTGTCKFSLTGRADLNSSLAAYQQDARTDSVAKQFMPNLDVFLPNIDRLSCIEGLAFGSVLRCSLSAVVGVLIYFFLCDNGDLADDVCFK